MGCLTTGNPYLYAIPEINYSDEEIYINLQTNQELNFSHFL